MQQIGILYVLFAFLFTLSIFLFTNAHSLLLSSVSSDKINKTSKFYADFFKQPPDPVFNKKYMHPVHYISEERNNFNDTQWQYKWSGK